MAAKKKKKPKAKLPEPGPRTKKQKRIKDKLTPYVISAKWAFLGMGRKLCSRLAAENRPRMIKHIIDTEVKRILGELAEAKSPVLERPYNYEPEKPIAKFLCGLNELRDDLLTIISKGPVDVYLLNSMAFHTEETIDNCENIIESIIDDHCREKADIVVTELCVMAGRIWEVLQWPPSAYDPTHITWLNNFVEDICLWETGEYCKLQEARSVLGDILPKENRGEKIPSTRKVSAILNDLAERLYQINEKIWQGPVQTKGDTAVIELLVATRGLIIRIDEAQRKSEDILNKPGVPETIHRLAQETIPSLASISQLLERIPTTIYRTKDTGDVNLKKTQTLASEVYDRAKRHCPEIERTHTRLMFEAEKDWPEFEIEEISFKKGSKELKLLKKLASNPTKHITFDKYIIKNLRRSLGDKGFEALADRLKQKKGKAYLEPTCRIRIIPEKP